MHAVSLTTHAKKIFQTTSKSENHMQNSDVVKKMKNACGVGEFEAEFKKALGRESGAKGYCLMKKNRGSKIS
jgi:hypothetical protein